MTAALSYFDGYTTNRLPANLLQAQRDYFGAHTYERLDAPRGEFSTRIGRVTAGILPRAPITHKEVNAMNLPLNTNLTGKVAVVTGAAGTLCSVFSKALAASGAKVALLGRTYANVQKLADEITAEGGTAKAYECNVLDKAAVMACHEQVRADFGPCDILLNGAGGNHPSATTDKEYYEPGDLDADTKSFFDLDETGVASVFNLNFMGILIPTQAFARDMVAREGCNIINISSMNAYTPLTKIPAYSGAKSAVSNFTQWLAVHFPGSAFV